MKGEGIKDTGHLPVLLDECMMALHIRAEGRYLDCTFGRGGHSKTILEHLNPEGVLLALDRDMDAVTEGRVLQESDKRFHIFHSTFSELDECVREAGLFGKIDGVLMDVGVSSPQLDEANRGFSFQHDGPLDMRMDQTQGLSAADWLAVATEDEITRVLKELGEEKFSRRIARRIVERRDEAPIESTLQLAELVSECVPKGKEKKHPATRTFQAIRIFVNAELEQLQQGLKAAVKVLAPGGRLAVICFHSLEDRLVKRFMRDLSAEPKGPRGLPPPPDAPAPVLRLVGKAVRAGKEELERNPRARSAVLRVAERLPC